MAGKDVRRRGRGNVSIGPDLNPRKPGGFASMITGLILGTVVFFVVSYILVYGVHH